MRNGCHLPHVASIHAPARGATAVDAFHLVSYYRFNPRSRTGSDIDHIYKYLTLEGLQSTLPHGERLWPFFTFAPQ